MGVGKRRDNGQGEEEGKNNPPNQSTAGCTGGREAALLYTAPAPMMEDESMPPNGKRPHVQRSPFTTGFFIWKQMTVAIEQSILFGYCNLRKLLKICPGYRPIYELMRKN